MDESINDLKFKDNKEARAAYRDLNEFIYDFGLAGEMPKEKYMSAKEAEIDDSIDNADVLNMLSDIASEIAREVGAVLPNGVFITNKALDMFAAKANKVILALGYSVDKTIDVDISGGVRVSYVLFNE